MSLPNGAGSRLAYAATKGRKQCIVAGGQEGPECDSVSRPAFSPDGKHLVYAASEGKGHCMVVDGREGKAYDALGRLTFSPDGQRLAYPARRGDKWLVVVDGQEGKSYDAVDVDSRAFSPDGRRVAYAARRGKKWLAAVDGQEGPEYDAVTNIIFSPDSRRVAYWAGKGTVWVESEDRPGTGEFRILKNVLVVDGQESKEHSSIERATLCFSADSQHVACAAYDKDQGECALVDGQEGPRHGGIHWSKIVFSPIGARRLYVAVSQKHNGTYAVVLDGQQAKPYDYIGGSYMDSPAFSPDGRRVAYEARRGKAWLVVVDDQETPEYDSFPLDSNPTFDGPDGLHFLALRDSRVLLVEVPKLPQAK